VSTYQDKKYGAGMRVCNLDMKKSNASCCVCGKSHRHDIGGEAKKK
jgi:hypothetical protein